MGRLGPGNDTSRMVREPIVILNRHICVEGVTIIIHYFCGITPINTSGPSGTVLYQESRGQKPARKKKEEYIKGLSAFCVSLVVIPTISGYDILSSLCPDFLLTSLQCFRMV